MRLPGKRRGIIRPGVPVFYAQTTEESDSVIARTAEERGSFCKKIGKDAYEILGIRDKHIAFSCSSAYYGNTTWKLNNTGIYQPGNAMAGAGSDEASFRESGRRERWRAVLADLKWAGADGRNPADVYVDGAHNISAVEAFTESVPEDGRENVILFSAVQDKDYEKMAECLCRSRRAALLCGYPY